MRPIWVFLITIPYWVNLLIRTVSMKFLLRDQGPLNDFLINIGPDRQPDAYRQHQLRGAAGPVLFLPALHGAADLRGGGALQLLAVSEAAADLYATKWVTLRRICCQR